MAPSSDQSRNSILMVRWRHHKVFNFESAALVREKRCHRLESVCPPLILLIHMKQKNIVYNYSRGFTSQISSILYQTPAVAASGSSNFGLGCSRTAQTCDAIDALGTGTRTGTARCFGCDHYALKFK